MRRLEDIFPYDNLRKGQRKLIDFIFTIFSENKIGLAYAPTGIGKTISVLVANALLHDDKKLIIITRTKSQARIYLKEIRALAKKGVRIPYIFLRSRQELCPLARKGKLAKIPYFVFIKICEYLRTKGKCKYYTNSIDQGEFSEKLIRISQKVLERGATSKKLLKIGKTRKLCPYELARYLAGQVKIIVGAYPYIVSERIREIFVRGSNINLSKVRLVIDEAHNFPEALINNNSVMLKLVTIERTIRKLKQIKNDVTTNIDIAEILQFLEDLRVDIINIISLGERQGFREFEVDFSEIISRYDFRLLIRLLDLSQKILEVDTRLALDIISIHRFLEHYIEEFNDNEYVSFVSKDPNKQEYVLESRPLDPAIFARRLFASVNSAVLMSGTLYPIEYYKVILGLNEDPLYLRTEAISIESEFPMDALKIVVDLELTSQYELRTEDMYKLYAERILFLLQNVPKTTNILVVFPSYVFLRDVLRYLRIIPRHYIVEERTTKIDEVLNFLRNKGGVIFCVSGGKFVEGVDYRINNRTLVNMIVIAGLPFPEYNLYLDAIKRYYLKKFGDEFYARFLVIIAPMVRRIMQIAGRLIRNEKDRGLVIIMDKRFRKYSKYFPKIPWQLYVPYKTNLQLAHILKESVRYLVKE